MTVESKVKKIISDQTGVPVDQIQNDQDLVKELGADSMDIVEIIIETEYVFDLNIPDESAEKLKTVQKIIDYITGELIV